MSGRTYGVVAGLALIVAQICCTPPVQALPMHCPMKASGCPIQRQNNCSVTAPQRSTAVTPKPIAVAATLQQSNARLTPIRFADDISGATPALHRAPILVLRI